MWLGIGFIHSFIFHSVNPYKVIDNLQDIEHIPSHSLHPPLLPILQLHVWSEIKWHYFQLASVLFRFELQQVILTIVYR